MRIMMAGVIALCCFGHGWTQDERSTDAKARTERLRALQSELTRAATEGRKKIADLEDATEKRAAQQVLTRTLNELRPKLAEKSLELAKENPKDDVAMTALIDAFAMGSAKVKEEARQLIVEHHLANPKIDAVLPVLARKGRGYDEALLKKTYAQNPAKSVKAVASYYLAQNLKEQAEGAKIKDADIVPKIKEALAAFEKVAAEYSDPSFKVMNQKIADLAKREIVALKKSPIGKETPEIQGEDIDGKEFKISDYRGKVVLLDFWGHW